MTFTVEETNLMCCYDRSSRRNLIDSIRKTPFPGADAEMKKLTEGLLRKLEKMTDEEFGVLHFAPDSLLY